MLYNKVFTKEVEYRTDLVERMKKNVENEPTPENKRLLDGAESLLEDMFNGSTSEQELWEQEHQERLELCNKWIEKARKINGLKRVEFGSDLTDPKGFYDGGIFFTHARLQEDYGGDEGWELWFYLNGEEVGHINPYDIKTITTRRTTP